MSQASELWASQPPASQLPLPVLECLITPGSLTAYLQASGRRFAVQVLYQGLDEALRDEWALLQRDSGQAMNAQKVYARQVCLLLDDQPVVLARSVCLAASASWRSVLERGNRSLGLSLFGGLKAIERGQLEFRFVAAEELLYQRLHVHGPEAASVAGIKGLQESLPARRCLFRRHGEDLIVCEMLLPALSLLLL